MRKPPPINRNSEAYYRVTAAGFKIYETETHDFGPRYDDSWWGSLQIRVMFECACGRKEIFARSYSAHHIEYEDVFSDGKWDAALDIERQGATSVEHLKSDGFSPEEIKRIRYVYDLYEENKKMKGIVKTVRAMSGYGHIVDYYMDDKEAA